MKKIKGFIQSVKTSPWHISLRVRDSGQTNYILISRGVKAEFLYTSSEIPVELRLNDKVKEKFNHELKNSFLLGVSIQDNFIVFNVSKNKVLKLLFVCFCEKKMIYGFVKKGYSYLPYLAKQLDDSVLSIEDIFTREKRRIDNKFKVMKLNEREIDSYNNYVGYEAILEKNKSKQKRKLLKKKTVIAADLNKLRESIGAKVLLASGELDYCFKDGLFEYGTIKLKFKKGQNFYQSRDLVFKKLKAFEGAIKIQEQRLKNLKVELSHSINLAIRDFLLYPATSLINDCSLDKSQVGTKYIGPDEVILLVGRNGKENNLIRKNYSNKDDFWFHEVNHSGPHGFLRLSGSKLENKYLDFVGSIFCEIENKQSIKLIYTRVRNLRSTKGKAGLIVPTKSKEYEYVRVKVR